MSQVRFGIDLGGTKIEIIALADTQGGTDKSGADISSADICSDILYQKRVDTPQGNYSLTIQTIVDLVVEAESMLKQTGSVGVGIPGSVSHKTGLVKNANSVCLIGQDLQGDLEVKLKRPVKLENDANCFTLSEAVDGAAQGAEVVFGVIIGTGCGGGVIVNGQVLNGINAIGGEWGHNPLPWATAEDDLLDCYCGLKGCNETFLSGSGLARHYAFRSKKQSQKPPFLSAKQIVLQSEQGGVIAGMLMQDYTRWLAKGLASVINLIDPDVIVLGGGMSNIERLYTDVPKIWDQWVFSDQVTTKLVAPKFGDASGVRGAAWL
ncbi:MAG: fructokinase [Thiomicrorhabdus sp.]|nr:MAG: fructokinase [Thiomicrorhabdus sp.]